MKWLKKIIRFVAIGSASLVIAACYGIGAGYDYYYSHMKKLKTSTSDDEPIEGLKVTLYEIVESTTNVHDLDYTDTYGEADLSYNTEKPGALSFLIEDIDTDTNGSWQSTNISFSALTNETVPTVIMREE